jgi:nucleoside-diphosphate-sugar epimerase
MKRHLHNQREFTTDIAAAVEPCRGRASVNKGDDSCDYERYVGRRLYQLGCDQESTHHPAIVGETIVVTGASGCVGNHLVRRLVRLGAGRVVAIGMNSDPPKIPFVDTHRVDVRDLDHLARILRRVRPDMVFHLAAIRSAGVARRHSIDAVATNVIGTQNVIDACTITQAPRVVLASSVDCAQWSTTDTYVLTKAVAEWIAAEQARLCTSGIVIARLNHVVDNGIVLQHFEAALSAGRALRVSSRRPFHIQSAAEGAGLLICAAATATQDGKARIVVASDAGRPVTAAGLAYGLQAHRGVTIDHVELVEPLTSSRQLAPRPQLNRQELTTATVSQACTEATVSMAVRSASEPDLSPGIVATLTEAVRQRASQRVIESLAQAAKNVRSARARVIAHTSRTMRDGVTGS